MVRNYALLNTRENCWRPTASARSHVTASPNTGSAAGNTASCSGSARSLTSNRSTARPAWTSFVLKTKYVARSAETQTERDQGVEMTDRIITLAVTRVCETLYDHGVHAWYVRSIMQESPEVFEAAVQLRDALDKCRDGRTPQ